MKAEVKTEVSGRFTRIEAIRPDGTIRVLSEGFDNLILNNGLDRLGIDTGTQTVWFACQVGSSNATPTATDTALGSRVAGSPTIQNTLSGIDQVNNFVWRRNTYEFASGVAAGVLAEIGIGWEASDGPYLFSRTLIKDSGGSPTTITVLSDEILRVTWEVRFYYSVSDTVGSFTLGGNKGGTYSYTQRVANLLAGGNAWSVLETGRSLYWTNSYTRTYTGSSLGSITGLPTGGAALAGGSASNQAYVSGSFERKATFSYSVAQANDGTGISTVVFGVEGIGAQWQMQISPPVLKTSQDVLALEVKHSWARRP